MNTAVSRMTRAVERTVTVAAGAGLLALMALFCADVIARYVAHAPLPGVYELTTTLFLPMVVFLGMAVSVRSDTHVQMSIVTERLPEPAQRALRAFGLALAAALWGAIAWVVGDRAIQSMAAHEVSTVSFALPVFWGYLIVAVGSALMAVTCAINIGRSAEHSAADATVEGV